jgi:vitamin B12 transporter
LSVADGWTAVFGAEHERSRMTSASPSSFTPNPAPIAGAINLNSGYGQIQGEVLPGLTLTGGLRHDSHDTFGGHTLGQAAAAWAFNEGATVLRASFGQGFKAPTLYQLYSPFGNTRLTPESAESWDGGIEQHFADGAVKLIAVGFLRNTTNQIDFVSCPNVNPLCVPGKSGVYDNIARSRAYGLELAGAVQIGHLALEANYTYTHTENTAVGNANRGKSLARRPKNTANLSATYTWDIPLTTGIGVRHAGDAFDDAANRFVLGHYTLVDLRASWAINDKLDLYGRLENLFDVKYATTRNYGTLGRGVYGGVRAHF